LNQGSQQCRPFPASIQDSTSIDVTTQQSSTPNSFVLQAVTHTTSGGTPTFRRGQIDDRVHPLNDLAQAGSNHCALLR
jgi:hypothetical protein